MPVEFLSDEQTTGLGRFVFAPGPQELSRFRWLDEADRRLVGRRRREENRLGFAIWSR